MSDLISVRDLNIFMFFIFVSKGIMYFQFFLSAVNKFSIHLFHYISFASFGKYQFFVFDLNMKFIKLQLLAESRQWSLEKNNAEFSISTCYDHKYLLNISICKTVAAEYKELKKNSIFIKKNISNNILT